VITDTRKLSGPAKALFKSAKEGKYGVEVQLHDQIAALDKVARHLGMFSERQPGNDATNPLHLLMRTVQGAPNGSIKPIPQHLIDLEDDED
jgi:hypothetical protein